MILVGGEFTEDALQPIRVPVDEAMGFAFSRFELLESQRLRSGEFEELEGTAGQACNVCGKSKGIVIESSSPLKRRADKIEGLGKRASDPPHVEVGAQW